MTRLVVHVDILKRTDFKRAILCELLICYMKNAGLTGLLTILKRDGV